MNVGSDADGPEPVEDAADPWEPGDGGNPDVGESEAPGELRSTAADDRARVQALTERLRQLENLVGDLLDGQRPEPGSSEVTRPGASGPSGPVGGAEPVFGCLVDFVAGYFAPLFDRPARGGRWRWCPQWFDHGEAVSRLAALWQAWEAMHAQGGTALGFWYRDHLDHQLPILLGADGPFRGCAEQHWPILDTDRLTLLTPPPDNRVWETV